MTSQSGQSSQFEVAERVLKYVIEQARSAGAMWVEAENIYRQAERGLAEMRSLPDPLDATDYSVVMLVLQTGIFDEHLEEIKSAVQRRKQLVALEQVAKIKPGDTIEIANCSPKLLNGAKVTVKSIDADGLVTGVLLYSYGHGRRWQRDSTIVLRPNHVGRVIS